MKTQGASLGPWLPGCAGSFNLHCLSKDAAVCTPKQSSDSQIQGQKAQRYHSLLEKLYLKPPEITGCVKGNETLFILLQTLAAPGMKRKLNSREISRCIYIIFSTKYIRRNIELKVCGKLCEGKYTQDLIISNSVKLKFPG